MFGPAGFVYTYFTYGNHWMLCITAEPDGPAAAVLVRAAIPQTGLEEMRINRPKAKSDFDLLNGPGKLCAALSINQSHYGLNALDHKSTLQIESAVEPHPFVTSTRIGLAPGKGDEFRWRFVSANNIDWASHPKSSLRRLDPQLPGYR
jgi:DNA-3-methyladenine glycosylase